MARCWYSNETKGTHLLQLRMLHPPDFTPRSRLYSTTTSTNKSSDGDQTLPRRLRQQVTRSLVFKRWNGSSFSSC